MDFIDDTNYFNAKFGEEEKRMSMIEQIKVMIDDVQFAWVQLDDGGNIGLYATVTYDCRGIKLTGELHISCAQTEDQWRWQWRGDFPGEPQVPCRAYSYSKSRGLEAPAVKDFIHSAMQDISHWLMDRVEIKRKQHEALQNLHEYQAKFKLHAWKVLKKTSAKAPKSE